MKRKEIIWRRGWDSNPFWYFRIYKLQIINVKTVSNVSRKQKTSTKLTQKAIVWAVGRLQK